MKKILLVIINILISYSFSSAQVKSSMDSLHDYCYICSKHEHLIIKPPYTKTFRKELPFLMTSGLTFAAGFIANAIDKTKSYTKDQLNNNVISINNINAIDRSSALNWSPSISKTSDYVLATVSILPALFLSEHHTERDITTLIVMYAEVFTFNYGITEIAKSTANRPRPYVYNPEIPMGTRTGSSSRQSFFSGHTSQTAAASFYFAKVITDYHPTLKPGIKIGLWVFAGSVPAINGYLRVKAGKHFPTDVIAGYVVGATTGWLIPELHRTKSSKEAKSKLGIGVIPYKNGMMMNLTFKM